MTLATTNPSGLVVNGQDERGRFVKGHKLSKGNTTHLRMARLQREMLKAVTPERMREIAEMLISQTLAGSDPHARLLLKYVLPTPEKTVNVNTNKLTPDQVKEHIRSVFGLRDEPRVGSN